MCIQAVLETTSRSWELGARKSLDLLFSFCVLSFREANSGVDISECQMDLMRDFVERRKNE